MSAALADLLLPLLPVAGVGQLLLAATSLLIPRVLGWRAALAGLAPLPRQLFWTYATYVACAHVFFGLVTLLLGAELAAGGSLARALCAFMAAWWGARVLIAALGVERRCLPDTPSIRWAHRVLLLAFTCLTTFYAALAAGAGAR